MPRRMRMCWAIQLNDEPESAVRVHPSEKSVNHQPGVDGRSGFERSLMHDRPPAAHVRFNLLAERLVFFWLKQGQ